MSYNWKTYYYVDNVTNQQCCTIQTSKLQLLYCYIFRQTQKRVPWKVAVATVQHSKITRLYSSRVTKRPHSPAYQIVVENGRYTTVVVAAAADHTWRRGGRFVGNTYGPGRGRIWLDDVVCNGNESNIDFCDHSSWGVHNCSHSQDVSVSCVTGITATQVRACANRVVILKSSAALWSIKMFSIKYKCPITRGHIALSS